jgi:hypothetical protein
VPKSFCQKITNPNCKHIKAAKIFFVRKAPLKILVKLTPGDLAGRLYILNEEAAV